MRAMVFGKLFRQLSYVLTVRPKIGKTNNSPSSLVLCVLAISTSFCLLSCAVHSPKENEKTGGNVPLRGTIVNRAKYC